MMKISQSNKNKLLFMMITVLTSLFTFGFWLGHNYEVPDWAKSYTVLIPIGSTITMIIGAIFYYPKQRKQRSKPEVEHE